MQAPRLVLSLLLVLSSSPRLNSQESLATPQALPYLRRSFAALTGGTRIRDVTLTGTATRYDSSRSESGTFVLTAVGIWQSQFNVNLPSGARSETRTISAGVPYESGTGPNRDFYTFGSQDLMTAPAWFFPAFVLAPGLSSSGYASSYVGKETRAGVEVVHLMLWQQSNGLSAAEAATIQPLTPHDIYLNSSSLLPVAIAFKIPGGNGALDIPVEIRFSDYRQVQSRQVPYQLQAYVQSTLVWDIQLSGDAINTGAVITASSPN